MQGSIELGGKAPAAVLGVQSVNPFKQAGFGCENSGRRRSLNFVGPGGRLLCSSECSVMSHNARRAAPPTPLRVPRKGQRHPQNGFIWDCLISFVRPLVSEGGEGENDAICDANLWATRGGGGASLELRPLQVPQSGSSRCFLSAAPRLVESVHEGRSSCGSWKFRTLPSRHSALGPQPQTLEVHNRCRRQQAEHRNVCR